MALEVRMGMIALEGDVAEALGDSIDGFLH